MASSDYETGASKGLIWLSQLLLPQMQGFRAGLLTKKINSTTKTSGKRYTISGMAKLQFLIAAGG
jgi:hypothetical protein